jgi:hypothetical protein
MNPRAAERTKRNIINIEYEEANDKIFRFVATTMVTKTTWPVMK